MNSEAKLRKKDLPESHRKKPCKIEIGPREEVHFSIEKEAIRWKKNANNGQEKTTRDPWSPTRPWYTETGISKKYVLEKYDAGCTVL